MVSTSNSFSRHLNAELCLRDQLASRVPVDLCSFIIKVSKERCSVTDRAHEDSKFSVDKRAMCEIGGTQHGKRSLLSLHGKELYVQRGNESYIRSTALHKPLNRTLVPEFLWWSCHHVRCCLVILEAAQQLIKAQRGKWSIELRDP